jgi:small subunit ribosomal protein S6
LQHDYEILLMLDPDLSEERQEEIVVRIRELIEKGGGTWVGHDPWGKRRLAFEIDKKNDGIYHLLQFDADPETLDELTRILKISDGVMRHLATRRIASGHGPGRPGPEPVQPAASEPEPEPVAVEAEPVAVEAEPVVAETETVAAESETVAVAQPEYAATNTRSEDEEEE